MSSLNPARQRLSTGTAISVTRSHLWWWPLGVTLPVTTGTRAKKWLTSEGLSLNRELCWMGQLLSACWIGCQLPPVRLLNFTESILNMISPRCLGISSHIINRPNMNEFVIFLWAVLLRVQYRDFVTSDGRIICWIGNYLEGSVRGQFEALSWYLLEGIEWSYENVRIVGGRAEVWTDYLLNTSLGRYYCTNRLRHWSCDGLVSEYVSFLDWRWDVLRRNPSVLM
jgi:hypothetical protein